MLLSELEQKMLKAKISMDQAEIDLKYWGSYWRTWQWIILTVITLGGFAIGHGVHMRILNRRLWRAKAKFDKFENAYKFQKGLVA